MYCPFLALSLNLLVRLISESYHGLSFGRIVTSFRGIHCFAKSINLTVNSSAASSILPLFKTDQSVFKINSLNFKKVSPFEIPDRSCI